MIVTQTMVDAMMRCPYISARDRTRGDDNDASHDPTKRSTAIAPKIDSRVVVVVGSVWRTVHRCCSCCCADIELRLEL